VLAQRQKVDDLCVSARHIGVTHVCGFTIVTYKGNANLVLDLPWLDDEQVSLYSGTTRVFTLMYGKTVEMQVEDRRLECQLMSFGKIQKLMRKTRRNTGRNAEFYGKKPEHFRSLFYDDFPDLVHQVESRHVCRQWDHPIDTTGPMKHLRLNKLSPAERAKLNRQLKDAVEADLIRRPKHNKFGSPILFVRKADCSLRLCIDYRDLNCLPASACE
jgi:hypothetical protein